MGRNPGKSPLLTLETNKWADLIKHGQIKYYPKNYTIVSTSTVVDRLYYILEGKVKYSLLDQEGNEKILAILGKGSLFGEGPLLANAPTNISAVATSGCKVCELTLEQVVKSITNCPELAIEIIKSMSYKIKILIDQVEDISFKCPLARIANLIYKLATNYGIDTEKGIKLQPNFTHQELANLVGCSRVSVSRALNTLKSEGLIDYSRCCIIVKQLEKLKDT